MATDEGALMCNIVSHARPAEALSNERKNRSPILTTAKSCQCKNFLPCQLWTLRWGISPRRIAKRCNNSNPGNTSSTLAKNVDKKTIIVGMGRLELPQSRHTHL